MCEALRELMKDDLEKKRQEGRQEEMLRALRNVVRNVGVTPEEAMKILEIAVSERNSYLARL